MNLAVVLQDKETDVVTEVVEEYTDLSEFLWHDGNAACDCQRGSYFYYAATPLNLPCTGERIRVVEARIIETREILDWTED